MQVLAKWSVSLACLIVVGAANAASGSAAIEPVDVADRNLFRAGAALAQRLNCMACHQVETRRVGPPLASIGDRYANPATVDATRHYLANAIRQGGRGKWSAVPMPAQPQVSEADALTLADWVLSLARPKP